MYSVRKIFFTLLFFQLLITGPTVLTANNEVNITATVTVCQDGVKGNNEQCDMNDLGGQACNDFGFFEGILSCNNNCTINTSQCFSNPSVNSGGYLFRPPTPKDNLSVIGPEDEFILKCFKENPLTYLQCLFIDPVQEFKPPSSLEVGAGNNGGIDSNPSIYNPDLSTSDPNAPNSTSVDNPTALDSPISESKPNGSNLPIKKILLGLIILVLIARIIFQIAGIYLNKTNNQ